MSKVLYETQHPGEYIQWETSPQYSREKGILKAGEKVEAGTVLSIVAGKWEKYTAANVAEPIGVAFSATDAFDNAEPPVATDTELVVSVRVSVFNVNELVWDDALPASDKAAAIVAMKALGLIVA